MVLLGSDFLDSTDWKVSRMCFCTLIRQVMLCSVWSSGLERMLFKHTGKSKRNFPVRGNVLRGNVLRACPPNRVMRLSAFQEAFTTLVEFVMQGIVLSILSNRIFKLKNSTWRLSWFPKLYSPDMRQHSALAHHVFTLWGLLRWPRWLGNGRSYQSNSSEIGRWTMIRDYFTPLSLSTSDKGVRNCVLNFTFYGYFWQIFYDLWFTTFCVVNCKFSQIWSLIYKQVASKWGEAPPLIEMSPP